MSTQITAQLNGGAAPHSQGLGSRLHPHLGAHQPPPPTQRTDNKLLGPSDIMVKSERDDGVDLSYDSTSTNSVVNSTTTSSVKKEGVSHNDSVINRLKSEAGVYVGGVSSQRMSSPAPGSLRTGSPAPGSPTSSRSASVSSTSAQSGGRLKFYKEGRVLLELTHRSIGDGEKVSWVPSGSKKVYWPPGPPAAPLSARLDSNASTNTITGSDGSIETGSHNSAPTASPWGSPSPRLPPWQPSPPHRIKPTPSKLVNPSSELLFAMKPPQGVRNYRKKIRTYKRKCRQPGADIKIGLFVLKLECQASAGKVKLKKKVASQPTAQERSSHLEGTIAKIITRKSQIHVPISAWRVGRTDLANLVKNPPSEPASPVGKTAPGSPSRMYPGVRPISPVSNRIYPASPVQRYHGVTQVPGGGMKVKSELKLVTETCTSPITSSPARPTKVKAETRTVSAETRHVPMRTLPITPTLGRVKSTEGDSSPGRIKVAAITSLLKPEMPRVRMEIGPSPHQDREPSFASPRKRFLKDYEGSAGPSPAKHRRLSTEHRLSTDSLGSAGDRASPYLSQGSPVPGRVPGTGASHHLPPHHQDVKPFSSFSIDSIISSQAAAGAVSGAAPRVSGASSPAASRLGSYDSTASPRHHLASSSVSSPSRHRRDSTQLPTSSLASERLGMAVSDRLGLSSSTVPDSPSKVHAPTPTRPRPAASPQPPPGVGAPGPPASAGFPFLYPHHPLLAAGQAAGMVDPRLLQLAALQQQAAALQQQLGQQQVAALQQLGPAAIQQQAAALQQHLQQGGLPGTLPGAGLPGLAANPFGLYPAAFNPYLAGSVAAAGYTPTPPSSTMTPMVWTPPVATPTPPNSNSSQRETPTPTRTLTSPTYPPLPTSLPTSTVMSTVTAKTISPPISTQSVMGGGTGAGLKRDPPEAAHKISVQSHSSSDAPLNLSMKPTSL